MNQTTDTPLFQQIAESLRLRIAQGEIKPGERLPAVRTLAQQWNCTPGTVSRAYKVLGEEGLVSGHRGGGTRVTEQPLPGGQSSSLHWAGLINQAERFLLETVAQGHTPAQVQSALSIAVARWQTMLEERPQEPVESLKTTTLRFAGSHDLTVDLLARLLAAAEQPVRLDVTFSGSLGGLMSLSRGEADLAGVHLWDQADNSYNASFVRRVLPRRKVALITLVKRSLGLIVPQGNPQALYTLEDLVSPKVRWVNRQVGSGTRVWLDAQLDQTGINSSDIPGYGDAVKATHMEVAEAVRRGAATAGLGIFAAAAAYELDFIPLAQETYQLAVPERVWGKESCYALLEVLRSDSFSEAVQALGGYDTAETGRVTWI